EPVDRRLLVCTGGFRAGWQPKGGTNQLTRVNAGRSFASASQRQAPAPAPQKILRCSRRLFKAAGAPSQEHGQVVLRPTPAAPPAQGQKRPHQIASHPPPPNPNPRAGG